MKKKIFQLVKKQIIDEEKYILNQGVKEKTLDGQSIKFHKKLIRSIEVCPDWNSLEMIMFNNLGKDLNEIIEDYIKF